MRSRSTVTGSFGTGVNWVHKGRVGGLCTNPLVTTSTDVSYTGEVKTKTIVDCVTPRFISLVREGQPLPMNPVVITTDTEVRIAGSGSHSTKATGAACWQNEHSGSGWWLREPWLVTLPPFDDSIINTVVNNAIAQTKEAIWDAATDAVQLRQLANFAGQQWRRVNGYAIKAALRARKRYKKNPFEVAKAFAEYWLEYRYGWKPLIFSLEDALEAFNSRVEKGNLRRGYSKVPTELNLSATATWSQDSGQGTGTETHSLTGSRTYRGMALGQVDNNSVRWGADPLLATWEVIPYSFVVDWFFHVGTWLNAISPFSGAHLVGAMGSVKDEYELRQDFSLSWAGANHTGSFATVSTVHTVEQYTRFASSVSLLPVWNPRLTPVRILDVFALVLSGSRRVRDLLH